MTFERIIVDLVGPLTPSSGRHRFILMVVDYATRYPEAMPLWNAKASMAAQELAILFTQVSFPCQIMTDWGMAFMGKTLKALGALAGMQAL